VWHIFRIRAFSMSLACFGGIRDGVLAILHDLLRDPLIRGPKFVRAAGFILRRTLVLRRGAVAMEPQEERHDQLKSRRHR
jgi:hypothetical protein